MFFFKESVLSSFLTHTLRRFLHSLKACVLSALTDSFLRRRRDSLSFFYPLEARLKIDKFKTYGSLVDLGCKKHCRVHHGKDELYKTDKKIKKIILTELKNFGGTTNVRLCKLRSMDKRNS